jgi:hypothetical protein
MQNNEKLTDSGRSSSKGSSRPMEKVVDGHSPHLHKGFQKKHCSRINIKKNYS